MAQTKQTKRKPQKPLSSRALALKLIGQVKGQRKPIATILQGDPAYQRLASRDQALIRALVTHFFRHHYALDAAFAPYLSRPLESLSPAALGPLRLATVELLVMGSEPHAALNESVSLAPKSLRGLVNAVLRKLVQDRQAAQDRFAQALAVPPWLQEGWHSAYGEDRAAQIRAGLRQIPDLDLSLKPKTGFEGGREILPDHRRVPVTDPRVLPGYDAGDWWVQDLAASLPVRLLGDVAGKDALDICAAPGGKTLQLAAAGAHVTALDISKGRLARVQENLDRTKLTAALVCHDAATFVPGKPGTRDSLDTPDISDTPDTLYDVIVLDAPCSASGTLRRHPEWPWIHARKDQLAHIPLQALLLRRALTWLRPGGRLVYAVCSLFPEEGEAQIERALNDNTSISLVRDPACPLPANTWDTKKGWLRTTPNTEINMDGFFAAVLTKA